MILMEDDYIHERRGGGCYEGDAARHTEVIFILKLHNEH